MEGIYTTSEKKLPELLAPAGNMQSFLAAVESGADAVYIGAKEFSARQYAENFSDKDLSNAVKYAHERGVNVYLALNTLIRDDELNRALEVMYKASCSNVDAIIIQDIGLAAKAVRIIPGIRFHASTQMTIHNFEGVNLLKKLGFKRVVLSRELSLQQVDDIVKRANGVEIEIFVHGALCVSYSGQCLFSSMVGGRSGNRGRCAQPCRQRYKLVNYETGQEVYDGRYGEYLLSPKDLCTIEMLPEIVNKGIHSLKIEGRMKSPEYVATVTRIYRKHLDFIASGRNYVVRDDDINDLKLIFNRGGFTKGLIGEEKGISLMSHEASSHRGIEAGEVSGYDNRNRTLKIRLTSSIRLGDVIKREPGSEESTTVTKMVINGEKVQSGVPDEIVEIPTNHVWAIGDAVYKVYDKKLIEKAAATYSGKLFKKVPLYAEFKLSFGNPIELTVWDEEGNKVEVKGRKNAEEAQKVVLTPDKVLTQLESLGNTPYYLAKTQIEMEDELFLPISEVNDVRRKAVESIANERIERRKKNCEDEKIFKAQVNRLLEMSNNPDIKHQPRISVFIPSFDLLQHIKPLNVSRIYIPSGDFFEDRIMPSVIEDLVGKGTEIFIAFPRITLRAEIDKIYENMKKIESYGFTGALVGNYGLLKMFKILKNFKIHADYSFNLFNRFTAEVVEDLGLDGITASPELELKQVQKAITGVELDTEIIVHGRTPLMVGKYCPIRSLMLGSSKADKECNLCKTQPIGIRDKTGVIFPMIFSPGQCHFEVLNSKTLCMAWDFDLIKNLGMKYLRLHFTNEEGKYITDTIKLYSRLMYEGQEVLEDYSDFLEEIKQNGFTKGHYFRGIE